MKPIAHAPYEDPEEFIVEWTDRIWMQRGVGLIRENYAADALVHSAYGTTVGQEPVIQATVARIAGFPRRVGQAEDVVWEARGDDGFLSSHRILSTGVHDRLAVPYGPATNRSFITRGIANCLYVRGRMVEEWVVRDDLALVMQLGLDPGAIARRLAFPGWRPGALGEAPKLPVREGDSGPRPDEHPVEVGVVLELIDKAWNHQRFDLVADYVGRDVFCHTTRHRQLVRVDGYQRSLLDLLSPFPDAYIEVRDIVTNDSPAHGGVRVAVQWLLRGTYSGLPAYGEPTSSPIAILGASQFLIRDGRVAVEWRVYDEMAVLTQVVRARGDQPG